jgi:hypothetical protein
MSGRADPAAPTGAGFGRATVRVNLGERGAWEIVLPDQRERVVCDTLDDATRTAYQWAASRRPCEVIVFDAYHRVFRRELVNGH